MALTYRQALNRVLRRLGQSDVDAGAASLNTDYTKLVGSLLNDIKEQVEDATNWRSLRQTLSVTITGGLNVATITGANERSRVLRIADADTATEQALVYDVTVATGPYALKEIDLAVLLHQATINNVNTATQPSYFALDNSASDVLKILVYPTPVANRSLQVTLIVPQDYLADSDLDVAIKVPSRPIVVGTIWAALEERGEELGPQAIYSEQKFNKALDDAVSRDNAESGDVLELVPV